MFHKIIAVRLKSNDERVEARGLVCGPRCSQSEVLILFSCFSIIMSICQKSGELCFALECLREYPTWDIMLCECVRSWETIQNVPVFTN